MAEANYIGQGSVGEEDDRATSTQGFPSGSSTRQEQVSSSFHPFPPLRTLFSQTGFATIFVDKLESKQVCSPHDKKVQISKPASSNWHHYSLDPLESAILSP